MNKEDLFLETSKNHVDLQIESIKELKSRAGVLLGFTVAFIGFVISNDTLRIQTNFNLYNLIPIYALALSMYLYILSLVVKTYSYSPNPIKLKEYYQNKKIIEIKKHITKELNTDFKENDKEITSLRKIINFGILIESVAIVWIIVLAFPIKIY